MLERGLFGGVELDHLVGPVVAVEPRPDENERTDAFRRLQRDAERDHAAEGRPDQGGLIHARGVERVANRRAVVDHVRCEGRLSEPGQVRRDHPMVPRERLELRLPHARVGDARVDQRHVSHRRQTGV